MKYIGIYMLSFLFFAFYLLHLGTTRSDGLFLASIGLSIWVTLASALIVEDRK